MTQKNLQNRHGRKDFETKFMVPQGEMWGGREKLYVYIYIYTHTHTYPYMYRLLCAVQCYLKSTESSVQYCVITSMGNNLRNNRCMSVYNWFTLLQHVHPKRTQLSLSQLYLNKIYFLERGKQPASQEGWLGWGKVINHVRSCEGNERSEHL